MDFKDETSFRGMIHYNWFINNWFLINYQVFAGTSSHLYVSFACGKRKKNIERENNSLKDSKLSDVFYCRIIDGRALILWHDNCAHLCHFLDMSCFYHRWLQLLHLGRVAELLILIVICELVSYQNSFEEEPFLGRSPQFWLQVTTWDPFLAAAMKPTHEPLCRFNKSL